MDMVMLVVAADEGIMPQTKEHLSVCRLLGVRQGLVALTKIDMVDDEWMELVQEDVREYLSGTFLANAPVVPVSSVTGAGLQQLKEVLSRLSSTIKPRSSMGRFRLPIDRVFTIRGFGTVVTGTVTGGQLAENESLVIMPGNRMCRIRGLQVHGAKTGQISGGQRAAVNIQNIDKTLIHRGMVLARPDSLPETNLVDADCFLLETASKPLKNRAPVRFHSGTAEIIGRLILLDKEQLLPGETGYVQIRLAEPAALLPGDRYVIRSYSPVFTIGGGRILDSEPVKHKRMNNNTVDYFKRLSSNNIEDRVTAILESSGIFGLSESGLERRAGSNDIPLDDLISSLKQKGAVQEISGSIRYFITTSNWKKLKNMIVKQVTQFHRTHPLRAGIGPEELRTSLKPAPTEILFDNALSQLVNDSKLIEKANQLRLADFRPNLTSRQKTVLDAMLQKIKKADSDGMTRKELLDIPQSDARDVKSVFQYLIETHLIQRLPGDLFMQKDTLGNISDKLNELFDSNETISVGEFRDALEISRKQAVPLLEYFDSIGMTIRKGNVRVRNPRYTGTDS